MAGYLAFSLSWQASRWAATAAIGEDPHTMGRLSAISAASVLPGLMNESLDGRHRWATSSSRLATASNTSSPASVTPMADVTTSGGTTRLHSVARDCPAAGVTGT